LCASPHEIAAEGVTMFAVIFEVQPKQARWNDYLALAGLLRPELEKIDGFIDNERFSSRCRAGRILSLSIWRNEKALVRWRTLGVHHDAQQQGRSEILDDYHLRVGEIVADTGAAPGVGLPQQRFDETEIGAAKLMTISEIRADDGARDANLAGHLGLPGAGVSSVIEHEVFEGITDHSKLLLLAAWQDSAAAPGWRPSPSAGGGELRHRAVRIIRDYGMRDRREAPQYYP
jgi:heme-degrading monooxygenase HmoA